MSRGFFAVICLTAVLNSSSVLGWLTPASFQTSARANM